MPFLQIDCDADKPKVKTCEKTGRVRIFYQTRKARAAAVTYLRPILEEMLSVSRDAERRLAAFGEGTLEMDGDEVFRACLDTRWTIHLEGASSQAEIAPMALIELIDQGDEKIGIDIPERLLWEAYVVRRDISHEAGGFGHSGRDSSPGEGAGQTWPPANANTCAIQTDRSLA